MKNDYDRSVDLICPTCANSEFEHPENAESVSSLFKCASCGQERTKQELLELNTERLNSAITEMKSEVLTDIKKDFGKMFKKR